MRRVAAAIGLVLLLVACGGSERSTATTTISLEREFLWEDCAADILSDHVTLSDVDRSAWEGPELQLELVAEIPEAIEATSHPDTGHLYVTTQEGELYELVPGRQPEVVLDLRRRVSVGEERGLLGVAFPPDGELGYVSFTDTDGAVVIEEYRYPSWTDRRQVFFLEQPQRWHNGGHMEFGPDGYLYVGLGDGGNIGDPDRLAQDRNTLYGTIIRIDPSRGEAYEVPDDNPFDDGHAEIVAYGLRNPWQFSFDSDSGDLWIGDVGQNCWEEIDRMPAGTFGQNFGWSRVEGPMRFRNDVPADYEPPVLSFFHDRACAVTGGVVYRGAAIPELGGQYVFADYCRGRLMAFSADGASPDEVWDLGVSQALLVSFGLDRSGEILVVGKDLGVLRLSLAE